MLVCLAGLANLLLVAGLFYFGQRKSAYSHFRHTISELGETGSPLQHQVAWGFFMPLALLLASLAYLLSDSSLPKALAQLAACLAIGYGGAAFFPCDPGSPMQGSWRQQLHNLAGGIEYVGGAVSLWQLAQSYGVIWQVSACSVGLIAVALSLWPQARWRGLLQRVAEAILLGSLFFAVV